MLVNIIGLGKVGQTLAKLLVEHKLATIAGLYNRDAGDIQSRLDFIGEGEYTNNVESLPCANLTLITVVDSCISEVAASYALNPNIQPGDIVAHCSGVLPSTCLQALKHRGVEICSIHPMHSFVDPHLSIQKYAGTLCAIEGDNAAIMVVQKLFTAFGSQVFTVAKNHKALYHAAGVFASNYLLTLVAQSLNCLQEAKVGQEDAFNLVVSLMQSTLNNLVTKKSARDALTGPLKRGDHATLQKHLQAFTSLEEQYFYTVLAKRTKELLM